MAGSPLPDVSLKTICTGGDHPTVDIVSIPSLPQLLPSYQPRDETKWIQEVFPHQFPTARVLLFRYDRLKQPTDVSWLQILRHGTTLLYQLVHRRAREEEIDRPLVFICHSFGGMVLKQTMIVASEDPQFSSILQSTIGVLFFGCIHNHTPATFEKSCLRCAALEMCIPLHKPEVSPDFRDRKKWKVLRDTMDKFKQLNIDFPIWSYYEGRKTKHRKHRFFPAESSVICAEPLVRHNMRNEQFFQVDMDHIEISKFPTRGHPLFADVITVLNSVLADCRRRRILEDATHHAGEAQTFDAPPAVEGFEATTPTSSTSSGLDRMLQAQTSRQLHLPYRSALPHKDNINFTGRQGVLSRMHDVLRPNKPQGTPSTQSVFVLCGLGGLGKTQIAVRFAMDHTKDFEVVLFARASDSTKLRNDLARFSAELGLVDPNQPDEYDCCEELKKWLEETDKSWLLILDNADNPDKWLFKFWPECGKGAIIITTRARELAVEFNCPVLPPMTEEEGVDLLIKLTGMQGINESTTNATILDDNVQGRHQEEREAAKQIVRRLGGLPLGIYHAANLITNECCSFREFLTAYDYRDLFASTKNVGLFRNPNDKHNPRSLQTVWTMNFEALPENTLRLLNTLSFFNTDTIEQSMLAAGAKAAFEAGETGWSIISDLGKLVRQRAKLLNSSLLDYSRENETLSIHLLVQAACHQRMSSDERQRAFHQAFRLLHHIWPVAPRKNRHRPDLWPVQGSMIQHIISLCRFYEDSQREGAVPLVGTADFAALLYNASWYNYERGTFEDSKPLLRAAERCCLHHGGCELILADIYGARASVATETNEPSLALENFKLQYDAMSEAVKQGVVRLPDIRFCFALGGMGNGTQGMGLYEKAEQWYRKCFEAFEGLEADRRMYGGNLAFCLISQGKLDEAQSFLGPIVNSAPDRGFRTGYILYPLGNLQIAKGQLDKAFKTHLDALKIYQQTLGDKHHRTADLFHKVAWHHHSRRQYAQAINLLNQALAVFNARPEWYRNERARTTYKLGCVLQDSGSLQEGSKLINEAEALRREILLTHVPPGEEKDFDGLVMFWSR
ncbi:protein SERAC1 [Podospora aff. communis PSN243]|uniref:Protein SERAC1 n=1 Tax=Podospora aff. communis PSN243 TaxID=3040156 RepID=A0AAV9G4T9_9PEZI|nr:protein SERAC1 [Podospora aff. communis PSN243]